MFRMEPSQTRVTRAVRQYIAREGKSQADIARYLGITQSGVSKRLRGEAKWSLDDVDFLRLAGVDVPLDHVEAVR